MSSAAAQAVQSALIMACLTAPAFAHPAESGWQYDAFCCNGDGRTGDCQKVDQHTVKPSEGGFLVRLAPGDHGLVTRPHSYRVPQTAVKISPDGFYHVCLYPTEDTLRCFYAPPNGS